jgi:hydroxypyruvate reductase
MAVLATREQRAALLGDLYWAAVTAAAPGPALSAALASHPSEPKRRVHLLALGKAAYPMAVTAVAALKKRDQELAGGLLVTPEPTPSPDPRLGVAVGDHPEPGPGSFRAAELLQAAVARIKPEDEVWVLLSGGATSLLAAPVPPLTPQSLTELYRLLLGSGLDITAMNRVRKRFSLWGGGRLAAALAPARVKNFTISDVIGDDLAAIGSGPCVPDTSTAAEVRALLTSAGLWERVPEPCRQFLLAVERGETPETPKPEHPAFKTTQAVLVASNRLALEAACAKARTLGLSAHLVDAALAGEAASAGARVAAYLLTHDGENRPGAQGGGLNKDAICVWGGETTVTLGANPGRGGRAQELALAAAKELVKDERGGPEDRRTGGRREITVLVAGTDGRDGPTDAAGAIVDGDSWQAIRRTGRDPARDLASHNAYDALASAGALFKTGMTGTNVMDVVIGLIIEN